jgi:hypothetical protein
VQDTTPPIITLNGDALVTLECDADSYDELGASAADACDPIVPIVIGGDVVDVSTPGTYVLTYDATDRCGNTATQITRTVVVEDTTPPVVAANVLTNVLWLPGHKFVDVGLSVEAIDGCDQIGTAASVTVEVWSDETEIPDTGDGTGRHAPDYKALLESGEVGTFLRNERRAQENGRVYLIVARAEDSSGNVSFGFCTVVVPHDQSQDSLTLVAAQADVDVATIQAPSYSQGTTIADVMAPLILQGYSQHDACGCSLGPHQ